MIAFLYSLSNVTLTILFCSVVALVFTAAPLLRARLFGDVSEAKAEIARTIMTAVTGFTGVVLAFSLVQAQGHLRDVEKNVEIEATQLRQLDRLLANYGGADVVPIRNLVRDYAWSIVSDEWPKLSEHSYSERTSELFRTLTESVLTLQPTSPRANAIYNDMVRTVDQLAESRQGRLGATDLGLPPIFWEVIGILMALLVVFAAFFERQRALSLGGLGVGLALLITLVFFFDQPFLGHAQATPEPIVKTLRVMHDRVS